MTREELFEKIQILDSEVTPSIEFYVLDQPSITDGHFQCEIYKARMQSSIVTQITKLFYPKIIKSLKSEYSLIDYDPSLMPDYDVVWKYDPDNVPLFNLIKNELMSVDRFYDSTILSYPDIWSIWIKLQYVNDSFYIIKKITNSKVITTGGWLALIYKDDVFQKLDSDILSLDGSFDVFAVENKLLFESKQNFERAMLYQDLKREVAEQTLTEIESMNILANFENLRDFLKDDYHSINKLNAIKSKPYFRALTFIDCKRIIDEYNLDLDYDAVLQKFVIDNKAKAKKFIKVLNDDFLMSEMTSLKYAANSKEGV